MPAPVAKYNAHMGGVDLADQHGAYYPVGRPSVRWWRYLCWWLLQVAMVNAFILWKLTNRPAQQQRRGTRHIDFRLEVLRLLCKGRSVRKHEARQSLSQAGACSAQAANHPQQPMPGCKKNRVLCEKKVRTAKNYTPQTVFGCIICNIHLCKGLSFQQFHQEVSSGDGRGEVGGGGGEEMKD